MGGNDVSLRPVDLAHQPVGFQDRYKVIHKLCEALQKVSYPAQKLGKFAVSLECRTAKESKTSQSYRFNVGILLRDITKFKGDVYKLKINNKPLVAKRSGTNSDSGQTLIEKKSDVMKKLNALLIDQKTLEKHGYMTEEACEFEKESFVPPFVVCVRCNTNFERGSIMDPVVCRYHPSKKFFDKSTKTHVFPCCGESSSSYSIQRLGCTTNKHHVFKGTKFSELCSITKFLSTSLIEGEANVLALDCEMAFTSKGYEMVRLTIVDFFTSKTLFDEIVHTVGEVIDLNSQFSGVHEEDMLYAMDYEDVMEQVLSPKMINKNTIIIGHGLENDLNVMRLFHSKVLDTAIMYSTGHLKNSLKNLTFEILSKKIQLSEHDSSQDAIAAMDIIKAKNGISLTQTNWD